MLINGRAKGHKNSRLLIKIYIKKKKLYILWRYQAKILGRQIIFIKVKVQKLIIII